MDNLSGETVYDNYYYTALQEELNKKEEDKDKVEKIDQFIQDYIIPTISSKKRLRNLNLKILLGKDYPLDAKSVEKCRENPYLRKQGTVIHIANELHKYEPDAKLCLQIFADPNYFGCGLLGHWNNQEESTLRDINQDLIMWLSQNSYIQKDIAKGCEGIVDPNSVPFLYINKAGLSTLDGFMVTAQICMDSLKLIKDPFEVRLLFSCFPSLTDDKSSFDPNWSSKYSGAKATQKDIDLKKHLFNLLFRNAKQLKSPLRDEEIFRKAIILLLFSGISSNKDKENEEEKKSDKIKDKEKKREEKEERKKKEDYQKILDIIRIAITCDEDKESQRIFERAQKNYEDTLRATVGGWINMARQSGVKYFIGGPIGCGAFFNDPETVSSIIAEQFVKYGGEMKFVYADINNKSEGSLESVFEKAFKDAFEGKLKAKTINEYDDDYFEILKKKYENEWKGKSNKKNVIDDYIKDTLLKDKDLIEKLKNVEYNIKRGRDYPLDENKTQICTENPFEVKTGSTSDIVCKLHKDNPNAKLCAQIFADHTYYGCGLLFHWTTQEEATLRDTNPELMIWLQHRGLIKEELDGRKIKFRYVENSKELSTSDGYMVPAQFCLKNTELLEKPFETCLLFTSFPSLTSIKGSFDENGNVSWSYKYRMAKYLKEKSKEAEKKKSNDSDKRKNFDSSILITDKNIIREKVQDIYEKQKNKQLKLTEQQFRQAMLLLLFWDGLNKKTTIEEIVEIALGKYSEYDYEEDPIKNAQRNYEDTVRKTVGSWINMARQSGAEYFIGGPIGCGAFFNDPEVVSKIIAEQFVRYGAGMKFIYGVFKEKSDDKLDCFRKAFEEAFENINGK
ncbi:MAG: hypothetical protein MJ252_22220 [archaeon]|nr:hypothetical protein [archaeon]